MTMGRLSLSAVGIFSSLKKVFNFRDRLAVPNGENRSPSCRVLITNVQEKRSASKIALSTEGAGKSRRCGLGNRRALSVYSRPSQRQEAWAEPSISITLWASGGQFF